MGTRTYSNLLFSNVPLPCAKMFSRTCFNSFREQNELIFKKFDASGDHNIGLRSMISPLVISSPSVNTPFCIISSANKPKILATVNPVS
jgi:hypothetical protein